MSQKVEYLTQPVTVGLRLFGAISLDASEPGPASGASGYRSLLIVHSDQGLDQSNSVKIRQSQDSLT